MNDKESLIDCIRKLKMVNIVFKKIIQRLVSLFNLIIKGEKIKTKELTADFKELQRKQERFRALISQINQELNPKYSRKSDRTLVFEIADLRCEQISRYRKVREELKKGGLSEGKLDKKFKKALKLLEQEGRLFELKNEIGIKQEELALRDCSFPLICQYLAEYKELKGQ